MRQFLNFAGHLSRGTAQIGGNFAAAAILGPTKYAPAALAVTILSVVTLLLEQGWVLALAGGRPTMGQVGAQLRRSMRLTGLLVAALLTAAWLLSRFFDQNELALLLCLAAIAAPLRQFSAILTILAFSVGRSRSASILEISASAISICIAVPMVIMTTSPTGVMVLYIALETVIIVGLMIDARRVNYTNLMNLRRLEGCRTENDESLQHLSRNAFQAQLIGALQRNLDSLSFSFRFSPESFSAYSISFRIMMLGVANVVPVITRTSLPQAMIMPKASRRVFMEQQVHLIAQVLWPIMAAISAVGAPLLIHYMGSGWTLLNSYLPFMALAGTMQALLSFSMTLILSEEKSKLQVRWASIQSCIMCLTILTGLVFGIYLFVRLYLLSSIILVAVAFGCMRPVLNWSPFPILRGLIVPACFSIAVAGQSLIVPMPWTLVSTSLAVLAAWAPPVFKIRKHRQDACVPDLVRGRQ